MFWFDAKITDVCMSVKRFSLNVGRDFPIFDRGFPRFFRKSLHSFHRDITSCISFSKGLQESCHPVDAVPQLFSPWLQECMYFCRILWFSVNLGAGIFVWWNNSPCSCHSEERSGEESENIYFVYTDPSRCSWWHFLCFHSGGTSPVPPSQGGFLYLIRARDK